MQVHNLLAGSPETRCLSSGAIPCTAMMCMCLLCPCLFCCENIRSIEELSRPLGVHGKVPYDKLCRQRLEGWVVRTVDRKSKHRQCTWAREWVHHPVGIEVRVKHATHVVKREGAFAGDAWHRMTSTCSRSRARRCLHLLGSDFGSSCDRFLRGVSVCGTSDIVASFG